MRVISVPCMCAENPNGSEDTTARCDSTQDTCLPKPRVVLYPVRLVAFSCAHFTKASGTATGPGSGTSGRVRHEATRGRHHAQRSKFFDKEECANAGWEREPEAHGAKSARSERWGSSAAAAAAQTSERIIFLFLLCLLETTSRRIARSCNELGIVASSSGSSSTAALASSAPLLDDDDAAHAAPSPVTCVGAPPIASSFAPSAGDDGESNSSRCASVVRVDAALRIEVVTDHSVGVEVGVVRGVDERLHFPDVDERSPLPRVPRWPQPSLATTINGTLSDIKPNTRVAVSRRRLPELASTQACRRQKPW